MKNFFLLFAFLILGLISCQTDLEISNDIKSNAPAHNLSEIYTDNEFAIISAELNLPNLDIHKSINYYDFTLPKHSGGGTSKVNFRKATLGKVLFYDKDLSIDRTTSCASCHKQDKAFSDDVAFSKGANGHLTDRNSIGIGSFFSIQHHYGGAISVTSAKNKLFWDARADNFSEQMDQTFTNPKEMGISMDELVNRVNAKEYYKVFSKRTYFKETLSASNIKDALEEFMSAFHSTQSSFDFAVDEMGLGTSLSQDFNKFSYTQNLGKKLFNHNCKSCHGSSVLPSISNTVKTANNGLDIEYADQGIGSGTFKIPSLRNVEVTGPYMHDGRFETLEDVVDFYNDGVQPHPNLNFRLKDNATGQPKKLNLTNNEKEALVDFLKTLTDDNLLTSAKYQDPFKS